MSDIGEKLDDIGETLKEHNVIVRKMLDVMQKPDNKIIQAFIIGSLIAGTLGIANVIDTILNWVAGG